MTAHLRAKKKKGGREYYDRNIFKGRGKGGELKSVVMYQQL